MFKWLVVMLLAVWRLSREWRRQSTPDSWLCRHSWLLCCGRLVHQLFLAGTSHQLIASTLLSTEWWSVLYVKRCARLLFISALCRSFIGTRPLIVFLVDDNFLRLVEFVTVFPNCSRSQCWLFGFILEKLCSRNTSWTVYDILLRRAISLRLTTHKNL